MQPIRTLVVDDSAVMRRILTLSLETDPRIAVIGAAESASAARDMIKELKPDVLTLDLEMPGMDGVDTMKTLLAKYPKLRVLLVSGYSDRPGTQTDRLPDRAAFLQKPFGADELNEKISQVLAETTAPS